MRRTFSETKSTGLWWMYKASAPSPFGYKTSTGIAATPPCRSARKGASAADGNGYSFTGRRISPPWQRRGGRASRKWSEGTSGQRGRGGLFKRDLLRGVWTNHPVCAVKGTGLFSWWRRHPSFAKEGRSDVPVC